MKALRNTLVIIALLYAALIVYAYLPYPVSAPETFAGKNSHFINLNGTTIHYTVEGSGPALVLVHGFGGSTLAWEKLTPLLAQHYTVYALDLLGFGLSDKPIKASYTMNAQADIVCALINALQLEKAALIGHSMGGVIVADVARMLPEKITRLVLIEPGFYFTGPPAFLKYLFFPFDRAMAKMFYSRTGREKSLVASYYDRSLVTPAMLDAMLIARNTPGAVAAMESMSSNHTYETYEESARSVIVPSLLIWGERGEKTRTVEIKRSHRDVQGSRLIMIERCGHYVQDEKPEQAAQAILEFLQK